MAAKDDLWKSLRLLGNLGFLIALPLVFFGLIGRFLDKKFASSPWFLLTGLLISMIITSIAIYRKTAEIVKDMEEPNNKTPGNQDKK